MKEKGKLREVRLAQGVADQFEVGRAFSGVRLLWKYSPLREDKWALGPRHRLQQRCIYGK
jgi:hypothetical protein